ncbi:MAG: cyclic nucleotide-binding domain-containing protein [Chloroflexota bacterium]
MDAEQTLQHVTLFKNLTPKLLKSLARWAATRTFQPGQEIVKQGQQGVGLYCIQSGQVKVTQQTSSGSREIRTMGAGQCFGELSLLDDAPRTATITALETTTTVSLDKMHFLAELKTYPEIALDMLPILTGWLRDADRTIAELS